LQHFEVRRQLVKQLDGAGVLAQQTIGAQQLGDVVQRHLVAAAQSRHRAQDALHVGRRRCRRARGGLFAGSGARGQL
jgi:hypothetical protein